MLFIFGFGLMVGMMLGGLVVGLAAAADKEVPRQPGSVRLYQDRGARGSYQLHVVQPGEQLAIRGSLLTATPATNTAFGAFRRPD
jgi:hypothetical protein